MDTGLDFMQPEFLSILFFQQKNLVIFPYIDLKHLHSLETFTVGHNIIDVESTALYNLKEIIEGETNNSYSQSPNLFLVYNLDNEKLKEIMEIEGIRCILNVKDNAESLVNGEKFAFYNKKTKKFLNATFQNGDLEFERYLIKTSKNQEILFDTIQKIKASATRIFKEYVETGKLDSLPSILKDYSQNYWPKILSFVEAYFDIILPEVYFSKINKKRGSISFSGEPSSFSDEYEFIITHNRDIAKEFTLALHEYRSRKVNPANLELEQLFNPQKLYDYLRSNHWKKGIPKDFLEEWVSMRNTSISLTDELKSDFLELFEELTIPLMDIDEIIHLDSIITKKPNSGVKGGDHFDQESREKVFNFQEVSTSLLGILANIERKMLGNELHYEKRIGNLTISNFPLFKKRLMDLINNVTMMSATNSQNDIGRIPEFNHKKELIFIVDGANVAFDGKFKDKGEKASVEQVKIMREELYNRGANKVIIYFDAHLAHDIDDLLELENMERSGLVIRIPAGSKADPYILDHARDENAYIISNDLYREYREEYRKDWIEEKRIDFRFVDGKLRINPLRKDIFSSIP